MEANNPMKKNIKKIVYVMFENRSFDNLLGWLYDGDANPSNVHNIPANPEVGFQGLTAELQQTFAQPIKYKWDWLKDGDKPITRGVNDNYFPCYTPFVDPEETFDNITYQVYGKNSDSGTPTMKGFLQNYYDHMAGYLNLELEILNTYEFKQLPILNTLASSYGVSDEWFCSIPSQTSINRAFSICGNSVGKLSKKTNIKTAMVNNHYWGDFKRPASFTEKTIWEVLSTSGYSSDTDWKIYYSDKYLNGHLSYEYSYTYYMFEGLQKILKQPDMKKKYQMIDHFYADAKAGTLPKFSYIEPKYTVDLIGSVGLHGNDYHPPGDVAWGEAFLKQLYDAVKESPDWEDILFIVAWDEHGGTFDHIAPPTTAINPGLADEYEEKFQFNRFGVRVPMLFISPWVKENTVIRSSDPKTPFDHTSWLATLLDWFDLDPSLLGARTAVAPKFDAVVGEAKRPAVELPSVWNCKADDDLTDTPLTLRKAAEVARVMASHDPSVDSLERLRDSLKNAKTEKELADYYDKWIASLG